MERCEKQLSRSDVSGRLQVTTEMRKILPAVDWERDIPIRVVDDTGTFYVFYLSGRRHGRHAKPVFQLKSRRAFVNSRNITEGDFIYFWAEQAHQYRIALLKKILPRSPPRSSSSSCAQGFQSDHQQHELILPCSSSRCSSSRSKI